MIDALRNFFDLNSALVFFVYGQVFFVLGLAIALQSRGHSRLELGRSLRWLSLFAIVHGLHEWGVFFIPFQASYLGPTILSALQIIQAALLALSFTFLLQFGADMLRDRWPWLMVTPAIATGLWAFLSIALLFNMRSIGVWLQEASILARYLLGFPGALLSAYGLRYQAQMQIKPLGLEHIRRMLRTAGLALVAYAVLAGLVVPAGDFWPASWLNDSLPVQLVGVPIPVFRSIAGLVMAIAIIRAMEVFDLEIERMIEQMEIEQSLIVERDRIGRELHDGAIQQAYTAGLIVESARRKLDQEGIVAQRLDRAITVIDQTIASLRAYMHELRPLPTDISLEEGLSTLAGDPRFSALMNVRLKLNLGEIPPLDPLQTNHILAIVGEALSNAARHAQADTVTIDADRVDGRLQMEVADDGRGFVTQEDPTGYGLRNMRDRARLLGGRLNIETQPGQGTRVTLSVPLEED
ncbi:MAG: sensor histidine kinase [Candidatus Promineifilaceae bacterium]|nr:sensor histidine kinase [Candidatus Promineifilaceae bacterium]